MSEIMPSESRKSLEIIAEAGCNHHGDIDLALEMCRQAKFCGADTIKFQSFEADQLVNPGDVYEFCKKSQLSYEAHCAIIEECESIDIKPLFSVFDEDSLCMIKTLGLDEVKIPSGQLHNSELLIKCAELNMDVYLSTGMSSYSDVDIAVYYMTANGINAEDIVVMQCTTAYPAPFEDANLRVLELYNEHFLRVGYSDHVPGWTCAIGAVALGASVIEKHFILNSDEETPDACVSLNPIEFRMMVMHLREIEIARGSCVKRPRPSEKKMFHRRDYGSKNDV